MIHCPPRLACASLRDKVQKPHTHVKYKVVHWYLTQAEQLNLSHGPWSCSPCVCWWPPRQGACAMRCPPPPSPCWKRSRLSQVPLGAEGAQQWHRGFSKSSPRHEKLGLRTGCFPVPLTEPPRSLLIPQRKGNEDAVASHTKPFYCDRAFPHQELHTQTPGSGLSKHAHLHKHQCQQLL